jgi:NADH-quinone oxidoreductase subunit J
MTSAHTLAPGAAPAHPLAGATQTLAGATHTLAAATHTLAGSTHTLAAGSAGGSPAGFWILAVLSVAAGLGMVLARRAVMCAVLLAVVMLSLAVLYAMADAPFLAFVQIIVYTGAVLMLFLFVIMIVGVSAADSLRETIRGQRLAAGLAGIGLLVLLSLVIGHATIGPPSRAGSGYSSGNVRSLAALIFTRYVFAFEVTSALLITAALAAMVLAHRERARPKPTQAELARRRIAGSHPTPLPGPGVYARHDAVDLPALLPDGSPSPLSVSPVIARDLARLGQQAGLPGPGAAARAGGLQRRGDGAEPDGAGPDGAGPDGAGPDGAGREGAGPGSGESPGGQP